MSCSSNDGGGQLNMNRSCPFWAETSAAPRALIPARPMLSTITSVSFFCPHSTAYFLLNHSSYAGTKWTQLRIFSVFFAAWDRPGMMILAPRPAANAPPPAALMKSRLETPCCSSLSFFSSIATLLNECRDHDRDQTGLSELR